jgi:hypothetical protein
MARRSLKHLLLGLVATGLCGAMLAAGATAEPASEPTSPAPQELLPDLDQQVPSALEMLNTGSRGRPHWVLGFQSAVRNIGAGPLVIVGQRVSTSTPMMTATQLIDRADGSRSTVAGTGRLQYAIAPTHQHWHLLHFDRYELRRAGGRGALLRDQKTGFCLGDRYRVVGHDIPAAKPDPTYTDRCGLGDPNKLSVEEGITPGYGDNYLPYLEGQSLPVSGLPAGHYVLIHHANADRALRESSYRNNVASVLVDLRWHGSRPAMNALSYCVGTSKCDEVSGKASSHVRPVPQGVVATSLCYGRHVGANWALCGFAGFFSARR